MYSPELWNVTKPDHLVDTKFQYVEWSPNGEKLVSMPHPLSAPTFIPPPPQAYVIDYNVYVLGIIPVDSVPIPITTSGSKNGIIYGIPDWVYEGTYVCVSLFSPPLPFLCVPPFPHGRGSPI